MSVNRLVGLSVTDLSQESFDLKFGIKVPKDTSKNAIEFQPPGSNYKDKGQL